MLQHSSIIRSTESSLLTSATADEIHVAQILLHITTMIRALESGPGLKWGSKKRRSRSDEPYQKTDVREERPPPAKAEMEAAAASASPVTPLAFPPSESDDKKSNHLSNKTSKKRSREAYFDMIEELSHRRDLLRGEIESVSNCYNNLILQNSQLKAMKQGALNSWARKEEPKLESCKDGNLAMEISSKNHQVSEVGRQPLVEDQMAEIFRRSIFGPVSAQLSNGLGSINHMGPNGIPDLNVSAEEVSQPLDLSGDRRVRFAEARRRRKDIIRVKSMRSAARAFKFPRNR